MCGNWFWEYGHFFGICGGCVETIEEPLGKKLQHSKPKRKQPELDPLEEFRPKPWDVYN